MTVKIEFNKPESFDKWFSATLADCVAKGIVEKAVQRVHKRNNTNTEVQGGVSRD